MHKSTSGFTIVELIVVIVVIAILASISVVSYTGIQEQARNTVTINTAESWLKVLMLSYGRNGPIHLTDVDGDGLCLGSARHYPATAHLAEGQCHEYGGNSHLDAFVSSQLEAAITKVAPVSTGVFAKEMKDPHGTIPHFARGMQYVKEDEFDVLYYLLEGEDQDCVLSGSEIGGSGDGMTECYVPISEILGEPAITWDL